MNTGRDPALRKDAAKMNLSVGPLSGEPIQAFLKKVYATCGSAEKRQGGDQPPVIVPAFACRRGAGMSALAKQEEQDERRERHL